MWISKIVVYFFMIKCSYMKDHWRLLGWGLFLSVVIIFPFLLAEGSHGGTHELSGYAWSSNIGWISFKGSNYGVELFGNDFQKYAWSSNIGWIRFDKDVLGTPPGGGVSGVRLNGSQVEGWARACSVFANVLQSDTPCSGSLKSDSERGGWDGWISMNGTSPSYGVTHDATSGKLSGFAWGADVVGWIDFCADATTGACVTVDSLNVLPCTANGGASTVNINTSVTWQAPAISGGTAPYTYCWGTMCTPSLGGNVNDVGATVSVPLGYPSAQTAVANFKVTDSSSPAKGGSNTCSIKVEDQTNPTLTVYVDGNGTGSVTVIPVGANGTINGCQNSNSPCVDNYPLNTVVAITASPGSNPNTVPPGQPYEFIWNGEPGCTDNVSPCSVTVGAGGKSVRVTFSDQTSVTPTFTVNSSLIKIDFHNAGQSAESNKSIITLTSAQSVDLCVNSFISFTGNSIENIISSIPIGNHLPVQCILGGGGGQFGSFSCSSTPPNCVTLNPGGSTTFSVLIPEKLIQILNNSPYGIKLKAGNKIVPITFEYRVRDIRP